MDTIKDYLENIFKALPKTEKMLRLRTELFNDMEAKYHELRQSGKTENEAIGKVIGEFGSIDELLDEMGVAVAEIVTEKEDAPVITIEGAREFLALSSKVSRLVGIGVVIILVGVSIFIGFSELLENSPALSTSPQRTLSSFSVVLLLLMIIPATALFIYSGTLLEKFKFIEEGSFNLDRSAKFILKEEAEALKPKQAIAIIIGVSLCIFSAALIIIIPEFGENISFLCVSLPLIIIAIAVFIFIRFGSTSSAYEKLLKVGEFAPKEKHTAKVIESISGIVWLITVCIFLIWGFMYDGWTISWIVFPITGILFGGFTALYSSLSKK